MDESIVIHLNDRKIRELQERIDSGNYKVPAETITEEYVHSRLLNLEPEQELTLDSLAPLTTLSVNVNPYRELLIGHKFKSDLHRSIFKMYSDGFSSIEISRKLKSEYWTILCAARVREIIRSIKETWIQTQGAE